MLTSIDVMKHCEIFIFRLAVVLASVGIGSVAYASFEKTPELTVWIRAGGSAVKSEISPFVLNVSKVLLIDKWVNINSIWT